MVAFLATTFFLQARHIIGGVITYECLGNDEYEFTMKVYRDCNCSMCAGLDDFAAIGVYKCDVNQNCDPLRQRDTYIREFVPLQKVTSVDQPDYPCLIPPNLCVEEGLYIFRLTLPQSDESYHVSYQRCCRNVTISNLEAPNETGATYTIELTPDAQRLCNSAPAFDNFPPTVICAGAPLEFDHSATDKDGDQLIYSFCKPLTGGTDNTTQALINTCEGAAPTPACPPPYDSVRFVRSLYTAGRPLAGSPVVSINPNTGLITGTPERIGQYVVGVCVEEYRGDTLLSRVFRDFQFNVASCEPTVVADIEATKVLENQEYVVNACGEVDVLINNRSYKREFVDVVRWTFDINGEIQTSSDWSPTFTFPGIGTYQGELILNPNTECGDTANVTVNVFPAIEANFEYEYDTCFANPVQFTDLSRTGGEEIVAWDWSFGDNNGSMEQNPAHQYKIPGDLPVTLRVEDNNECVDIITQPIRYFPVPSLIVVRPSEFDGCAPGTVTFNNLSFPIDETYTLDWDFGDGGSSDEISPTHTYEQEGTYTVSVDIISPIGCETDTIFPDLISVKPSPVANFSFTPNEPNNLEPIVRFDDQSEGAILWEWQFGEEGRSFDRNPTYHFRDTGRYEIKQIVTHPSGCMDTLIQFLDVRPEVTYYLPNAFTPNSDSVNDTYKGVGLMKGATDFEFSIWNRWGELVFQTNNPDEGWNGQKFNSGRSSPNGVYVVAVKYKTPRGEKKELKGFATLIR